MKSIKTMWETRWENVEFEHMGMGTLTYSSVYFYFVCSVCHYNMRVHFYFTYVFTTETNDHLTLWCMMLSQSQGRVQVLRPEHTLEDTERAGCAHQVHWRKSELSQSENQNDRLPNVVEGTKQVRVPLSIQTWQVVSGITMKNERNSK